MDQHRQLSPCSKDFLWRLKSMLIHYKLDVNSLILKLFNEPKLVLEDHEFQKIIQFGDEKVGYQEIENLFHELQYKMKVQVAVLIKEISTLSPPDLMRARFEADPVVEGDVLSALIQVKEMMLREQPYFVFDMHDVNKDESLHVEELNSLLVACSPRLAKDTDLRKRVLMTLFKYQKRKNIDRKAFFGLFGIQNVPQRIKFEPPHPVQEVQDDDEIAKKCIMSSKIYQGNHSVQLQESIINMSMSSIRSIPTTLQAFRYFRLLDHRKYMEMINLLEFYLQSGEAFKDPEGPKTKSTKYTDRRAADIFKNKPFQLFQMAESVLSRERSRLGIAQLIEPKDIIQGSIGDCYFLSSISSIIWRYPQHISSLFLFQVNPAGFYVVRLFNDGEWGNYPLDDKFPCDRNGNPAFARPHTNQIWVMLLEKAWAKIHLTYENIDLGSSLEGLVSLTGAPCKYYRKQQENVMVKIKESYEKQWISTCSGSELLNQLSKEETGKLGLIGKHAYSILKLIEVVDNLTGEKVTLIRMRNPWGDLEWLGDWSFTSKKWSQEQREKFNYRRNPDDGSFYLPWKQFQKYFGSVTVCSMVPGHVNTSLRINVQRHKSTYVQMKVQVAGTYTISLYQQSKRKYKHSQNYKLSESRLVIMREIVKKSGSGSDLQYIISGNKATSNVHLTTHLQTGTYFVSCKVAWRKFDQHSCVLTSYGPSAIQLQLFADRSISTCFKSHLINSYIQKNRGKLTYYNSIKLDNAYRQVCVNLEHGIGYIFFGNPTKSSFTSTINFKNAKGIKLIKPHDFPLEVVVEPESESFYGMFVSGEGYSYVMEEVVKVIK